MVIISKNISPGDYLNSLLTDQGLPVLPREKAEAIGIKFEQAVRAADAHEKGLQLLKNYNQALLILNCFDTHTGCHFPFKGMNMKSEKKFKFTLQIGDWSLDGHNHVEKYTLSCNAETIQDVRNAYFKAMRMIREDHHPHNIEFDFKTDAYQDFPKVDMQEEPSSGLWIAKVTAWFINQGNPKLACKVVKHKHLPTLHFVGYDTKHRHIPSIGYTMLDPN